jgi:Cu2+-exporting ATPase
VAELRRWVEDCGFHCAGQSVPEHICDPLMEPDPPDAATTVAAAEPASQPAMPQMAAGEAAPSSHEMMGHGGNAGMSMDAMVRDMRNRFLVAALLSIPTLLWSPIGRDVLNFKVAAPFGLRDDVWLLLLSVPVIFTRRGSSSTVPSGPCGPGPST